VPLHCCMLCCLDVPVGGAVPVTSALLLLHLLLLLPLHLLLLLLLLYLQLLLVLLLLSHLCCAVSSTTGQVCEESGCTPLLRLGTGIGLQLGYSCAYAQMRE